ncbi:MAG: hypothetical protein R2822_02165 [Spirosomataceae bacterium]
MQKIALDDLVDTVNTSALYALRVPDRLEVHLNGQRKNAVTKSKICQYFWLENVLLFRSTATGSCLTRNHALFRGIS